MVSGASIGLLHYGQSLLWAHQLIPPIKVLRTHLQPLTCEPGAQGLPNPIDLHCSTRLISLYNVDSQVLT